jgi:hypothetical protein
MIFGNIFLRKSIALFFLGLLTLQILLPIGASALTSGPSQPESKQFAVAGTSDMVDLFSGSFKYNLPVMDIDGYPINLSYQSGAGMDDEASWVGLGWNLNVGAINRSLRGLPDDLNGDLVTTEHYTAPKVTIGGRGTVKGEIAGLNFLKLKGSLSLGVFSDSYTGIGAEFGANAGLLLTSGSAGTLTAGLGLGAGINSNTSSGVDMNVAPSINLSLNDKINENVTGDMSISANLGYNTRQGLKNLTLTQSFGMTGQVQVRDHLRQGATSFDVGGIGFNFNTPPFYPQIGIPYKSTNRSYSIDIGGAGFLIFTGGGLTGYKYKREIISRTRTNPAYGFLYANRGTDVPTAMMDFMREKDNPVIKNMPNIAIPVATADIFSYSNQLGGGQFRLYRGGTGVVFDATAKDETNTSSLGLDYGFGAWFHGGVTLYKQNVSNKTSKWKNDNNFQDKADYKNNDQDGKEEHAYFKQMDEKNLGNPAFESAIYGESTVHVGLDGLWAKNELHSKYNDIYPVSAPLTKPGRQARRTAISYLTGYEASAMGGATQYVTSYPENKLAGFVPKIPVGGASTGRSNRGDKISEFTVTGDDGKRMVYGIPAYNNFQDEYSFAADPTKKVAGDISRNLIGFTMENGTFKHNHNISVDKYYHKERQPAYASSFLLSSILSPDYVDVTDDGITDDDLGTAIKFNYTMTTSGYQWRSPMEAQKVLYNRALNADPNDDKASVVHGSKELWYLSSIETKTKVMHFLLEERKDGLGVTGVDGTLDKSAGNRQRRLKEIRLYSKKDLTTPIKTVVFNYDYTLCKGVPNQEMKDSGKLTLTGLYFTYGSSTKGQYFPYSFRYTGSNPNYSYLSTDRWGNYKPGTSNAAAGFGSLRNDEFPYSTQVRADADNYAKAWNLTNISLPTGGEINVDYEAGDYAYVQDKQAMQMVQLKQLVDADGATVGDLYTARGFKLSINGGLQGSTDEAKLYDFSQRFLNGGRDFYAKLFVNVTDRPVGVTEVNGDYIPAYGEVEKVIDKGGGEVCVILKTMSDGGVTSNPFIFAAWQKMRMEYPMYAFPGYKSRVPDDMPLQAALTAIVNAIGNLREVSENFYQRAKRKGFASNVDLSKSFGRIEKADGMKLGGGARVKRIKISDAWSTLTGEPTAGATYGQEYSYTTTLNGKTISSGVASYEPGVGGDENPMRLPVPYTEDIKGALSNSFYLEKPFGESLFPAPVVGYSKVVVKDLNPSGVADAAPKTGWIQHEFYTSKDFPVQVDYDQSPETYNYDSKGWFSFMGGNVVNELILSQGYVVKLNDMHGKPKAERVFNQSGAEIANTSYYFNAAPLGAGTQRLVNKVDVVTEKGGIIRDQIIGREIEMITDMREQETSNFGQSLQLGLDVIPGFVIPIPIPHWPVNQNDEYRLFRSASVLKTVQYSGVLDRVVKTINGSTVTTKNVLYDAVTGDPVVTTTNNEFDDPVYQVNMPAYWMYPGMGGAFKNNNAVIKDFTTNIKGGVDSRLLNFLLPGDELLDLSGNKLWVVSTKDSVETNPSIKIIDKGGAVLKSFQGSVKLYRSGYRNQLSAPGASFVCLKNPVENGVFRFNTDEELAGLGVLDAKATLYDQSWGARLPCITIPTGFSYERPDRGVYIRKPNPPTDKLYLRHATTRNGDYGVDGARFLYGNNVIKDKWGDFWTKRLERIALWPAGVWVDESNQNYYNYETTITVPPAGGYSLGYAADDEIFVYIDGHEIARMEYYNSGDDIHHKKWFVMPLNLTPGRHVFRVLVRNKKSDEAAFAAEIYNRSIDDMFNAPIYQSNEDDYIVYSTKDWLTYPADAIEYYGVQGLPLVQKEFYTTPLDFRVNPYLKGFLGNWRAIEGKSYLVNRTGLQTSAPDIRKNGTYQQFTPYWYFSVPGGWQQTTVNNEKWVSTGTTTLFDAQGNGLESRDPLGIYKSAAYGFNNSVPTAVASNAMQREIFYDGFEDYDYRVNAIPENSCPRDSFNIFSRIQETGQYANWLDNQVSHTGRYSLKLPSPLKLYGYAHDNIHHTRPYLDFTSFGEYQRIASPTLYPSGFSPKVTASNYIFSAWIKDAQPSGKTSDLKLIVNGADRTLTAKAWVEGWKLVEGTFSVTAGTLTVELSAGAGTRVDDIRIYPEKATIKTFAYDPKNLRLMAELDENNLSTLYEYDDEGTLIRLKKETDRGIMTIKENRSSYRFKAN